MKRPTKRRLRKAKRVKGKYNLPFDVMFYMLPFKLKKAVKTGKVKYYRSLQEFKNRKK